MKNDDQDARRDETERSVETRTRTILPAGPIAALLTPRDSAGQIDERAFLLNLELACGGGMNGVCLCGATGEYIRATPEEKMRLLTLARRHLPDGSFLLFGAGGAELEDCVATARRALSGGATAVLLPPPHFYQYAQIDLEAFYDEAARRIQGPIILYNLPAFTNRIEEPLALWLIDRLPNIIGIKDSSGNLQILESLSGKRAAKVCRLVGHDAVLSAALETQTCDGAVSGVAGVLPELIAALFAARDATRNAFLNAALNDLLKRLDEFPAPWGLKLIAESRALGAVSFPTPLSATRIAEAREFQTWFGEWWRELQHDLR